MTRKLKKHPLKQKICIIKMNHKVDNYRYELKYILNESTINEALKLIHIKAKAIKKFESRTVNSIYFDDINFSNANDNLIGLSMRKKFRLRWYDNLDSVNFEVKSKLNRLNSKRLIPILLEDKKIKDLTISEINDICQKQIFNKFKILTNHNEPTLGVKYIREYYERQDGIRITIDNKISFYQILKNNKINDINFLNYGFSILEIKFNPKLLYNVENILKDFKVLLTRHSKYLIGLKLLSHINY